MRPVYNTVGRNEVFVHHNLDLCIYSMGSNDKVLVLCNLDPYKNSVGCNHDGLYAEDGKQSPKYCLRATATGEYSGLLVLPFVRRNHESLGTDAVGRDHAPEAFIRRNLEFYVGDPPAWLVKVMAGFGH